MVKFFRMVAALIHSVSSEPLFALCTFVLCKAREELPKQGLPRDLLLSQSEYKLIQLEALVNYVRSLEFTMGANKNLRFFTKLPLTLPFSEKFRAVSTPMQHILTFLKQNFELLHENLALQLVFPVVQRV